MGGKNVKITMTDRLLEKVAPYLCCGCGKQGTILCECCAYNINDTPSFVCFACLRPESTGVCDTHTSPLLATWIVSWRRDTLQRVIDAYKFKRVKRAALSLAGLLHTRVPLLPSNTIIVPVPTRAHHIRQRGYDHTLLIAQEFATLRHLEVARTLKTRAHHTQHTLSRAEREMEVKDSFILTETAPRDVPHLIIDDIVTTGSTLQEAARVLASSGVSTIWGAALAIQPLDEETVIC